MTKFEKDELYDEICRNLTDYENSDDEHDMEYLQEFYLLLVQIQNQWDELTSGEES
jgi:hypothetical protein